MLRTFCVLALLVPRVAAAYDLTSSSTGQPVHWAPGSVTFTAPLSPSPSSIDAAAARQSLVAAVATWQAALVDHDVDVELADGSAVAAPHTTDGVNTVRFAVAKSDPDLEAGLLARTFVAYSTKDGTLHDTDVVLDAVDYTWTVDPSHCGNEYDLVSALTHELGHAVGLAHSIGHPEATMYATGDACETEKRDLAADDVAGIAELYPPSSGGGGGCAAGGDVSLGVLVIAAFMVATRRSWRSRAILRLSALVGMILVAFVPAQAAQLRRLSLAELAERAVFVVRGTVTESAVTPELETDATVAVAECLGGSCPAQLVVRRHGGERDGHGLLVDGEARLSIGDEVVLYVRLDGERHARVLGGVQGAWRVEHTATTARCIRDLRGDRVLGASGWQAGEREVIDLAALRASVDASIRTTR